MAKTLTILSLLLSISLVQARDPASASAPPSSPSSPTSPTSESEPVLAPETAAGSRGTGLNCTDALLNLSSCLSYTKEGSNLAVPDTGCCVALAGLVDSQPICICELLSNGAGFGLKIDKRKAFKLPIVCKLETPDVGLCSVVGIPVSSPTGPSPSNEPGLSSSIIADSPSTTNSGTSTTKLATSAAALTIISFIASLF